MPPLCTVWLQRASRAAAFSRSGCSLFDFCLIAACQVYNQRCWLEAGGSQASEPSLHQKGTPVSLLTFADLSRLYAVIKVVIMFTGKPRK
jgi:hypothetical protein